MVTTRAHTLAHVLHVVSSISEQPRCVQPSLLWSAGCEDCECVLWMSSMGRRGGSAHRTMWQHSGHVIAAARSEPHGLTPSAWTCLSRFRSAPAAFTAMPKRHCCYCGRDAIRSHASRRGPSAATVDERIRACHYRAYAGIRSTSVALYLCSTHRSSNRPALAMHPSRVFDECAFHLALAATQLDADEARVRAWRETDRSRALVAPFARVPSVVPASVPSAVAAAPAAASAVATTPAAAARRFPPSARAAEVSSWNFPLAPAEIVPGLAGLHAEISQQTRQTLLRSADARAWMRATDFHNNYGGDFFNVQGRYSLYTRAEIAEIISDRPGHSSLVS